MRIPPDCNGLTAVHSGGGVRFLGGGSSVTFFADANAEQQQGRTSIGGRLGINLGL